MNRKVALHFAPVIIQIRFEDRGFFGIGDCANTKFPAIAASAQHDFSCCFSIAHPLRASTRSNQVALAVQFEGIDRGHVQLSTLSAADLEQIDVSRSDAPSDKSTESTIKDLFDGGWLAERRQARVHLAYGIR